MPRKSTTLRLTARQLFEAKARKRFIKYLGKAITAMNDAYMENYTSVQTLDIRRLYRHLTEK